MATKKAKKSADSVTRQERHSVFRNQAQKEFGPHSIQRASEVRPRRSVSSGSWQLDNCLGGGFTLGTMKLLWGWEHCGKTTIALKAASEIHQICSSCHTYINETPLFNPHEFTGDWDTGYWSIENLDTDAKAEAAYWNQGKQQCMACGSPYHKEDRPCSHSSEMGEDDDEIDDFICGDCGTAAMVVDLHPDDDYYSPMPRSGNTASCECGKCVPTIVMWVDLEGKGDVKWAESLGVDLERLDYVRANYTEAAFDIIKGAIKGGLVDAIIVDSLAGATPAVELEKSYGENTMGLAARLVNRMTREMPTIITQSYEEHGIEPTVFLLNQVRNKIGGYGGHTLYGGEGQKFACDQIIKLTSAKGEIDEVVTGAKTRNESIGLSSTVALKFMIDKNGKAPTRNMSGQCTLVTVDTHGLKKGTFDDIDLLTNDASKMGIISSEDGWKIQGWPVKYRIKADLMTELSSNRALKRLVQGMICDSLMSNFDEITKMLSS